MGEESTKKPEVNKQDETEMNEEDDIVVEEGPEWLENYIKYKFDLLNRTGKSTHIDSDETSSDDRRSDDRSSEVVMIEVVMTEVVMTEVVMTEVVK